MANASSEKKVTVGGGAAETGGSDLRRLTPAVDIYEIDDEGLVLLVDVPGVPAEAIRLDVDKGVLSIDGRFTGEGLPGRAGYRELVPCEYHRAFALRDDLDPSRITATLREGVLELRIPKAERARTRKIPIEST